MSEILLRALLREFPGTKLNRLLIEHSMGRLAETESAMYVVIPAAEGKDVYYAYREGSWRRFKTRPLAIMRRAAKNGTAKIKAPRRSKAGADSS